MFLLGRLGFLVTVERKGAVEIMVDQEGIVESLVYVSSTLLTTYNHSGSTWGLLKCRTASVGHDFDFPLTGLIVPDQLGTGTKQLRRPGRGAQARDEHRSVLPQVELVRRGHVGRALRSVSLHRGCAHRGMPIRRSHNMISTGLDG